MKKTMKKRAKTYSRRHIQEAIDYWTRMLREATEKPAVDVGQLIKQAEALGLKDLASAAKEVVKVQEGEELNEGAKGAFFAGVATVAIIGGIIAHYADTLKKTINELKVDAAIEMVNKSAGALEKINGWLTDAVDEVQNKKPDNKKLEELAAAMDDARRASEKVGKTTREKHPGYSANTNGSSGLSGAGNHNSQTSKPTGSSKNTKAGYYRS